MINALRNLMPLVALGLILFALIAPRWLFSSDSGATGRDRPDPMVRILEVTPQLAEDKLILNGTLTASEGVDIQPEIAGRVIAIQFAEGSHVQQGDLLLQLDDSELSAERDSVALRLELARDRARREQSLFEQGLSPEEDYNEVRNEARVLEAQLRLLEARLAKTSIVAPFSGRVGLRRVSIGDVVTPNTVITRLRKLDPIRVDFDLPERHARHLEVGRELRLRVTGIPGSFNAVVVAWDPQINPVTRTLYVRAMADNPDDLLTPGSFASIDFLLDRQPDAIMVPATALIPGLEVDRVLVVEDGRAVQRDVATGIRTRDRVQILNGLEFGDQVVIRGAGVVRPGQAVRTETANADIMSGGELDTAL